MTAEFVSFTQKDRRIALRRADITEVKEAGSEDEDQRALVVADGKPVRVEDAFDAVLDKLNE